MNFQTLLDFAGRHPMLSMALVALTVAILANEVARLFRGYRGLAPAELTALINRENALVIDMSAIADYEKGHIPGSRHVPPSQFDPEHKSLVAARSLPVVMVCRSGQTAAGAAARLKKAGFERVYLLEGGIAAWQRADLPLAKGR